MSPLMRGTVDLQITAERLSDPSVHWKRLFTQPFLLSVPPGHRLAGRSEVSLAQAAEEEFVMLRPFWGLRHLTNEICAAAGFAPRVAFEGHDLQVVRGLVAAGLGVAVIPSPSIDPPPARMDTEHLLRLTDEGASREVGLAWSRNRPLLPSAELFRQHTITRSRARTASSGRL
jgi:DNA-binding transcriptional LysR family regulator